ncbi:PREDICTED: cold-inducible RNA-binding protein B [Tarenaya hassleriana]|uniref:cold-inducible RNA-binding protein B n=1 Tax=Tarenaya hassleriana TaxID=28532 RepID=UPI00053C228A|nr:PREDICTED: cold-inducible RNA-binding protein B [Tarenaya hassleriana]
MAKRLATELFVSRLSFYTTERSLKQLFSRFGAVKDARLVRDPQTGRPKGFGFVAFESENDAQKALKALNGSIVDSRLIFVEAAKSGGPGSDSIKDGKVEGGK